MVQMKKIKRLCQSFTDRANEVNQQIISVIERWAKRPKLEDYVNHLQMVQLK